MTTFSFSAHEVMCKIVYYGPGLGGKTTNLRYIHKKVPEKFRGNLTSIETKKDRTLFFDLLPLEYGKYRGFNVRMQLYTVPGQVMYNASRKIVLKGVDGIVFVADSARDKMAENSESLENLRLNLAELGKDFSKIPLVLQFNKRDLNSTIPVEEMNRGLNISNAAFHEAVALSGAGVFETLKQIMMLVMENVKHDFQKPAGLMIDPAEAAIAYPEKAIRAKEVSAVPVRKLVMKETSKSENGQFQEQEPATLVRGGVSPPKTDSEEITELNATPPESFLKKIFSALFKWARTK